MSDLICNWCGSFTSMCICDGKFKIGDKVEKTTGIKFPGVIVSVYRNLAGEDRIVVECDAPEVAGLQHIYKPDNLRLRNGKAAKWLA